MKTAFRRSTDCVLTGRDRYAAPLDFRWLRFVTLLVAAACLLGACLLGACLLGACLLGACLPVAMAAGADKPAALKSGSQEKGVAWYDIRELGVEGKAWNDTKAPFDRLPAKAEKIVRSAVWSLSRHSAGMAVRFATASPTIQARWTLTSPRLAMSHMPATGVSGLDLYVWHEGRWRWLSNGRPVKQTNTVFLARRLPAGHRQYLLYLPLYNGVSSVQIGLPADQKLYPPRARKHAKPLVFYGTSITHGACASRPGMVHTALLGRWLDRPVVNLGFSGNGRMEKEVAQLMTEIDAAAYIIDCLPNITAPMVTARTEPLVRTLRAAHPTTPILLVEDRNYADSFLVTSKRQRNETSQAALRKVYEKLKPNDKNLHYLVGKNLIGSDGEGTVDTSHPNDLGFYRQAEEFRKALEPILKSRPDQGAQRRRSGSGGNAR